MTDREIMQQALDALEESVDLVRHEYSIDWRHGLPTRKAQLEGMKAGLNAHEAAITALRERLSQPEQEAVAEARYDGTLHWIEPHGVGLHQIQGPLYTTSPQQQAEPKAQSDLIIKRLRDTASKGVSVWGDLQMAAAREIEILTAERECYARVLAAQPQQQAEPPPEWPLIKNILDEYGLQAISFVAEWKAAQREWVGLTPEEILDLFDINNVYGSKWIAFARTVEAKLKEKNGH